MRPVDDTKATKILVETKLNHTQDARPSPSLARDAPERRNAYYRTRQTPIHTGGGKTVVYQHFAEQLAAAMKQHGLNASEVARRIWGTTKDKRNYDVARNRDRIGHYLSGRSYPEPENLRKLAEAVGLPVEQLAMPESEDNPGPRSPRSQPPGGGIHLTSVAGQPDMMRVQFDRVLPTEQVAEMLQLWASLLKAGKPPVSQPAPELGSVIENHNQA